MFANFLASLRLSFVIYEMGITHLPHSCVTVNVADCITVGGGWGSFSHTHLPKGRLPPTSQPQVGPCGVL